MVSATIDELRKLRDRGWSDDLFGNIGTAPLGHGWEDLMTVHPLAKVAVSVTGESGRRFSTATDEQGGYRFVSIPAAEYSIEPDPPAGYHHGFGQEVDFRGAPERLGCRIDWRAEPDGRISGRVSDTTGVAVPGFIMVERAEPDKAIGVLRWRGLQGQDTNDGQFSLELLAPGEYRLVFHPRDGQRINLGRTSYFPSSDSGLELTLGQHVDNVKFEIPASAHGR